MSISYNYIGQQAEPQAVTAITDLQRYLDSESDSDSEIENEKQIKRGGYTGGGDYYHIYFVVTIALLLIILWNVTKIKREIKEIFVE